MVRLSDSIKPEGGRRPTREPIRPAGETLPEVIIITANADIVAAVRRAVEVSGYRMRQFQSFEEALGLIRTAVRAVPVIDGDLEGARDFIDELSAAGSVRAVTIVPDRDTAEFFSGIPGLHIFIRPVPEDELLGAIRDLSPHAAAPPPPAAAVQRTLFPGADTTPTPVPAPPEPTPRPDGASEAAASTTAPATTPPAPPPPPDTEPPVDPEAPPTPFAETARAARLSELVPSQPPEGVKKPTIPPHPTEPEAPVIPPLESGQTEADREIFYERAVDIVYRFTSGHRSRSNPPLGDVTALVEDLVTRISETRDLCLQVVTRTPDFRDADLYLATHMVNVTLLAARMGIGRNLDERKLFELTLAAAVHDIGMTQLPEGLITRQGKLDQAGYSQVKQHPAFGRQILQSYARAYPWLPEMVYQEHERYDGSGYPEGLAGGDIHQYAVIIGLVDTYEALTHLRPFRDRMIPFNVLQQIIRLGGQLFPSDMVKTFIEEISVFPIGSFVRLNTGEVCKVVEINRGYPLRPIVRVLFASDGSALEQDRTIDLKAEPMLYITGPEDIRE